MSSVSRLWWTLGLTGLCCSLAFVALPGCGAVSNDDDTTGDDDASGTGDDDTNSGDDDSSGSTSIFDLNQNPPADKTVVTTTGIVTGITYQHNFWIEDATGGPYSGLYVYAAKLYPTADYPTLESLPIKVGDKVEVTASFSNYFASGSPVGVRELSVYPDNGSVTVLTAGAGVPAPVSISGLDSLVGAACTTDLVASVDQYISVLTKLPEANVVEGEGACGTESTFGQWEIADDNGNSLVVDDDIDYDYKPNVGDKVEITGVFFYSFGLYKIIPAGNDGINVTSGETPTPTATPEPGGPDTIYDLNQNPPANDTVTTTSGIVTGITYQNNFWIEDAKGGEYSGLYVFSSSLYPTKDYPDASKLPFKVGDEVEVTGKFTTYTPSGAKVGIRELTVYSDSGSVTVTGAGAGAPAPMNISDLGTLGNPACTADAIAADDKYLSVRMKLPEATVSTGFGACGTDPKFNTWEIDDGSSHALAVDDDIHYTYVPAVGDKVTIDGIFFYSFGLYKIIPLGDAGITLNK